MEAESETARMLRGELYLASDPDLVAARRRARRLCRWFNSATEEDQNRRRTVLSELLGRVGFGVEIEPPFYCDYGAHITLGDRVFMNFGCVLLDCNRITIGDGTLLGPGVHVYAATHPVDPNARRTGRELAQPVVIGSNVWVGGGAIICPGVEIGSGSVIGAGSVVARSVPAGHLAVGNPCRVVRRTDAT